MSDVQLTVVLLSEAFGEFWEELAEHAGASLQTVTDPETFIKSPDTAAVVLSAGGAERDALDWLDRHGSTDGIPVFAVGADPGRRMAAQAVGRGATDYFAVPEDVEILRNAVSSAVGRRADDLRRASADTEEKAEAFDEIMGESAALKAVLSRAERILPHANATALLMGETGTGKELLARALHDGSPRRAGPFVPVNCSALPDHLVESELFGHERGAFTDAHAAKPGLFEVADGGTLFLDEIGTLPVDLQAKLLRVLDQRQVRRVGSTRLRRVDLRIIAATNENLEEAMRSGAFRRDLFFRLSVVTLKLPPLRDRGDDVLHIANALLERLAQQHELPVPALSAEARRALLEHHWPGNVRELKNAVERALLLSPAGELAVGELLPEGGSAAPATQGAIPFPAQLSEITAVAAQTALRFCGGNRSEAARRLGISRRRLRRLLGTEQQSA